MVSNDKRIVNVIPQHARLTRVCLSKLLLALTTTSKPPVALAEQPAESPQPLTVHKTAAAKELEDMLKMHDEEQGRKVSFF